MAQCKECFHWEACKEMYEAMGNSLPEGFSGSAERCNTFVPADVTPKSELSDEEYETAAREAYNELMRSLDEAGGKIRELIDEKMRLIHALKSTVGWLNYFLAHNRDDIYYDKAHEARCCAEYLLMDFESIE